MSLKNAFKERGNNNNFQSFSASPVCKKTCHDPLQVGASQVKKGFINSPENADSEETIKTLDY